MKTRKILALVLAAILCCTLAVSLNSCNLFGGDDNGSAQGSESVATDIKISKTECELGVGETQRINVRTTPTGQKVEWTTSDESVASLSSSSNNSTIVTAVKAGTATITATSGSVSASCVITVTEVEIILDQSAITIDVLVSNTHTLNATVVGADFDPDWKSSDESIVTVFDGVVTAVGSGTATVTAYIGSAEATCEVTVNMPADYYEVTSANNAKVLANPGIWYTFFQSTSGASVNCVHGNETLYFNANGVTEGEVWYIRYQPKYEAGMWIDVEFDITISADARIYFGGSDSYNQKISTEVLTAGTYHVTSIADPNSTADNVIVIGPRYVDEINAWSFRLHTENDKSLGGDISITISDFEMSEAFYVDADRTTLDADAENKTAQLEAHNVAEGATVTYVSDNEAVATVDANGVVTALEKGYAKITATCTYANGAVATNVITIRVVRNGGLALEVELSSEQEIILAGEEVTLTAADGVVWTSADTSIATVDANGVVKGIATGKTTITATVGTIKESCTVYVIGESAKIAITQETITTEGKPGEFYLNSVDKYYSSISLENDAITFTTIAPIDTGKMQQIRYIPVVDGEEFVGEYVLRFVLTNNTDMGMSYQGNVNGKTTGVVTYTLEAGKSAVVEYVCISDDTGLQFNLKLFNYGIGTVSVSDIYVAPIAAYEEAPEDDTTGDNIGENGEYKITNTQDSVGTTQIAGTIYRSKELYNSISVVNGVVTMEMTELKETSTGNSQQIRYLPVVNGQEYIGKYTLTITITNDTDLEMQYSGNVNGATTGEWYKLAAGESVTVTFECESTESGKQFNIKLCGYGVGKVIISDMSYTIVNQ